MKQKLGHCDLVYLIYIIENAYVLPQPMAYMFYRFIRMFIFSPDVLILRLRCFKVLNLSLEL